MSGVVIPDPRGGHVWIYGVDSAGEPVKILVDASGHLQVETLASALPTGAATAARQDTMIIALQLIDDLRNALGSVNTDDFQVDVKTSGLPTGAATAAKQDTIITAMVNRAVTPNVYNVTMTSANTEYSQALPANTKKFLIKCRAAYDIKVCFTSGQSGITYVTVPAGMSYWEDLIQPSAITLYFQCATAAQVAEIVAWS
uniref:Tail protein n=1 Tax=viral metagenome TaxID=1070528 RepID=A0A6M3XX73_9ZZZZ